MLNRQVMKHFHIERVWSQAGYFETERLAQFREDVMAAIMAGGSDRCFWSGRCWQNRDDQPPSGSDHCGKEDHRVARSLSVGQTTCGAACPDHGTLSRHHRRPPNMKVPTQPERRERLLQEAVRKARKPIALFIDEAHDLHGHTLNGLKRLREVISAGGGTPVRCSCRPPSSPE